MGKRESRLQEPPFALPFDTILHGKYRVEKVLGFGGFGITYLGEDLSNAGRVAIKEYYPSGMVTRKPGFTAIEVSSAYEQFNKGKARFLQEARIIYHCNSIHVLSIFSLFEENGTAYYVMEFLEGQDLRHFINNRGGKLEWFVLKPLMLQIMDSLITVHAEGIIHRDISPDNIYISGENNAKLIDFGAARSITGNRSMSIILKRGYAPPEQYQSRGKQGPWTDIYALGGTIFRALTGEMPPESIDRIKKDTLRSPSSYGVKLPSVVDMAIMKAMNVREEDRFQSVKEFRNALADSTIGSDHFLGDKVRKVLGDFNVFMGEIRTNIHSDNPIGLKKEMVGKPLLIGMRGIYAHSSFTLDSDVVVGRKPDVCSIIFPQKTPGVSNIQFQICLNVEEGKMVIIDCDSTYGTFLNGIKIKPGIPYELKNGDCIQFGVDNIFKIMM